MARFACRAGDLPSTDTTSLAPSAAPATFCEISDGRRALLLDGGRHGAGRELSISCMRLGDAADRRRPRCRSTTAPTPISLEMSSVALAVCTASDFTSEATTAKPLPASPARAASMVALSASRLVCPAMVRISLTTSPIFCAACASAADLRIGSCASPTALRTTSVVRRAGG